ncbi:hypothetical protein PCURB6_26690 [Paenibacillus curdlanolyticus]|nr:hypothetical protein PCURB6_26690 [Paenibacillus curdlanolyticus]
MKYKNGDTIHTIYGETATIVRVGKDLMELTKLDKQIKIGHFIDGVPCYSSFIPTHEIDGLIKGR